MDKSSRFKDANIEKPFVDESGLSDPVLVFMEYGEVMVAQWDAHKKEWFGESQSFNTGVKYWSHIEPPAGWKFSDIYWKVV